MFHRKQLVCFAESVGLTLIADLFLLLPKCFLSGGLPFLLFYQLFHKKFLQLTISAVSAAVKSNHWEHTRFVAGTTVTQNWNRHSFNNFCKYTESFSTLSTKTFLEWNIYLSWSNLFVAYFLLVRNVGFILNIKTKGDTKSIFPLLMPLKSAFTLGIKVFSSSLDCRLTFIRLFVYYLVVWNSLVYSSEKEKLTEQKTAVWLNILYSTRTVYIMGESMWTKWYEKSGLWSLFLSTELETQCQQIFGKHAPSAY